MIEGFVLFNEGGTRGLQVPEEARGIRCPGSGITGNSEPPDGSVGNRA